MTPDDQQSTGARPPVLDVQSYLDRQQKKDLLRLLTCGSVDDGKSTLIGRLLHDSLAVYDDQLASLERDSLKLGNAGIDATGTRQIDFSLLVDGLKAEREQGITIDVAYRYFTTPRRKFIIADTPGHEQYTRNMATGASTCDLAVLLIDARHGVVTQTRRHAFIVSLLGIRHVVVAVNKMDLVDWKQDTFQKIRDAFSDFAAKLEFTDVHFLPMSALTGDGVVANGERMPWFKGAPLLEHLETVHIASDRNLIDLRLPVQLVIRPDLTFRGFAGTVASGVIRRGDAIMAMPSRRTSRVKALSTHDGELDEAYPPLAVTVTLEDEIDVSRGDVFVHPGNLPAVGHDLDAMLVWMSETPLQRDVQYLVKLGASVSPAMVTSIRYRIDVNTSHQVAADRLGLNEIGRVVISATRPMVFDAYAKNRSMGSFILIDRLTNATVAAGMVRSLAAMGAGLSGKLATQAQPGQVDELVRHRLLGQTPVTVWLTGLSKSNKTPIAHALERRLIEAGHAANVLDGARLRRGINRDLGFSGDDRAENLRRGADIARLCNDAGLITICAFVSPYAADRAAARAAIGPERFIEVWCSAPVAWCETNDEEGAYARARRGELPFFSGVNAPYEKPEHADLVLPTHEIGIDEATKRIWEALVKKGCLKATT